MNDYKDLVKRLREELAEVQQALNELSVSHEAAIEVIQKRDAELAALKSQEPVAVVKDNNYCPEGTSDELSTYLPVGTKLYTASTDRDAERYRWLRKYLSTKDLPILTGRGSRDEPDERKTIDAVVDAAMQEGK